MNSKYDKIGLYDHNVISYEKIQEGLKKDNIVAIVHATGTGKSYNALQLAYDNQDKKITYVVPSKSIIEHIRKIIDDNSNLKLSREFSNLKFKTYQSFIDMDKEEIEKLDIDMLILDEFHHIGAPVWGSRINTIIDTHPNMKIFGMTAYTVRDRGTAYERDMANPDTNEIFSNKVVSRYDLCDAMIDGVLPKPFYKSAYINLKEEAKKLEEKIQSLDASSIEYQEYSEILNAAKKRIHEAPSISDVVKRNIKPNGKYIYFCPPAAENGVNDMKTITEESKKWFLEMGVQEENIVFYQTTSEMKEEGRQNREAFYRDTDLEGKSTNGKLRVMFAINQYNEGIHAPNIDGVIMGRGTTSDIVYFEQLGRALSVRGETKQKFDEYEKYTIEQLLEMCKRRDIKVKENTPKEEIIEKLLAPTIIDLTNNFEFIRELENNLKDRVREVRERRISNPRVIKIRDASFDIEIENQDLFGMLKLLNERLTMTWEKMYEYAKAYYKNRGDLEVPQKFKTNNGYDYDENGAINLGKWISMQRQNTNSESEKGKLLLEIGMRFKNKRSKLSWEEMFEYAKEYYKNSGDLEVSHKFKTNNGYEHDENGAVKLGQWISMQRQNTNPESERGKLLVEIGMRFGGGYSERWNQMYEYAKAYYKKNGNLDMSSNFKTNNGYDYDENGTINLGKWIVKQRFNENPESERGKLLLEIGMKFKNKRSTLTLSWEEMFEYAKAYYEKHGNLEITWRFKTNNGYEYDENGSVNLGHWIFGQRQRVIPESERGKLLQEIGMKFENKKVSEKQITNICIENNIDLNINKVIIDYISVQEFRSKISFLQENNIPIVDVSGKLHEIFSMSNINMQAKYGISLEELISKYYNPTLGGRGI